MSYNRVIFFASYREGSRGTLAAFTGLFSVFVVIDKNLFDNVELKREVNHIINALVFIKEVHFKHTVFKPNIPTAICQLDVGKDIIIHNTVAKTNSFIFNVHFKTKCT